MMTTHIEQVAQALLAARHKRTLCDAAPFAHALSDPGEAFAVQDIVSRAIGAQRQGFPRYWKTGAAGREGVAPHAALPSEGVWTSPADARGWPFNICLVEAEIALRLARDITASQAAYLTDAEARGLIDGMAVAIELVDSRWQQGMATPALLKLADLQSHGALILGAWMPFADRDWTAQPCSVQIGSRPPTLWRGTHAAGDPLRLLGGWLRHASRNGHTVPAGTAVTTGTWCGMLPAGAGDRVTARFEGVGEAIVRL
jgi:2-keto-4-pentenoate hydratase